MAAPLSCDACEELLADYLLHALEPTVLSAVLEHLSTCDRCPVQLMTYEAVLAQLAQAVPQQEPPADLGARLLSATVEGPGPATAASTPLRPRQRPRWAFLLTAANVVLCLGVGWWTWHVQREAALVHQRWQEVQRQLALQRQALTLITAPEARPVVLRSDKPDTRARGVVLQRPEDQHAVLIVQDMPPLQRDRAYQLWLAWGAPGQRDNGGVFRVDEQGFGVLPITAPRPFKAYHRMGITEEPVSGSPGPTSPRVIGGAP